MEELGCNNCTGTCYSNYYMWGECMECNMLGALCSECDPEPGRLNLSPSCSACREGTLHSNKYGSYCTEGEAGENCAVEKNGECESCVLGYGKKEGSCVPCKLISDGCSACSYSNGRAWCTRCMEGYSLDYHEGLSRCLPCSTLAPTCAACRHALDHQLLCLRTLPLQHCLQLTQVLTQDDTQDTQDTQVTYHCTKCAQGFQISTLGTCTPCPHSCLSCSQEMECHECANGYSLIEGNCTDCEVPHCASCKNAGESEAESESECLECAGGYELSSTSQCLLVNCQYYGEQCKTCSVETGCDVCMPDSYFNLQDYCIQCGATWPNCVECSLSGGCLKCHDSYTLDDSKCILTPHFYNCTNLTRGEDKLWKCTQCQAEEDLVLYPGYCKPHDCAFPSHLPMPICALCGTNLDDSTCQECPKYYLLIKAVAGVFLEQFYCERCNSLVGHCLECEGFIQDTESIFCTACEEGYFLSENRMNCLMIGCPSIDHCSKCSQPDVCTSCEDAYGLNIIDANPTRSRVCLPCVEQTGISGCNRCEGDICTKCMVGNAVLTSTSSEVIENCISCDELTHGCTQCVVKDNGELETCLKCKQGYSLNKYNTSVCLDCSILSVLPGCSECLQEEYDPLNPTRPTKCTRCENGVNRGLSKFIYSKSCQNDTITVDPQSYELGGGASSGPPSPVGNPGPGSPPSPGSDDDTTNTRILDLFYNGVKMVFCQDFECQAKYSQMCVDCSDTVCLKCAGDTILSLDEKGCEHCRTIEFCEKCSLSVYAAYHKHHSHFYNISTSIHGGVSYEYTKQYSYIETCDKCMENYNQYGLECVFCNISNCVACGKPPLDQGLPLGTILCGICESGYLLKISQDLLKNPMWLLSPNCIPQTQCQLFYTKNATTVCLLEESKYISLDTYIHIYL